MAETETTDRSEVHVVMMHPEGKAVCLMPTAHGWALPTLTIEKSLWIRATNELNQALQTLLQQPIVALYCRSYEYLAGENLERMVYVVDNPFGPATLPPDAQWLDPRELTEADLHIAEHKTLLAACLQEAEQGTIPPERTPWSRPGWFVVAAAWMEQELERLGYQLLSPVQQSVSWALSCILSAATTHGRIFMKAGAGLPLFVNEPAVLTALAAVYPQNVPTPLSIETTQRWMLLDDFGAALADQGTTELRAGMLAEFARIQQSAAQNTDWLLQIGFIDRRLARLQQQAADLLLAAEQDGSLAGDDLSALRQALPQLVDDCRRLAAFGIPETINHGDLHLGNVAHHSGRLIFFDWTDACVAHPFLDMISIFNEKDVQLRDFLRDTYLGYWSQYAAPHELLEAWTLAERLAALHQAVTFHAILSNLEETPRKAFGDVLPHYVRLATGRAESPEPA